MAAHLAAGNRSRAQAVYSTACAVVGLLSAILLAAGVGIVSIIPANFLPSDRHVATLEMRSAVMALVIYGVLVIASDLPMAKYRATGRYPRGTWVMSFLTTLERMAVMLAAFQGFAPAAFAMAALRFCGVFWMLIDASRKHSDLWPRVLDASISEAKRMALLGCGMLLFTAAMAVNLQGPIIVLAAFVSPAAVGLFSVTRTLTRFGLQATGIVSSSVTAEFSLAWGGGDKVAQRRLFTVNLAIASAILTSMLVLLLLFGQMVARVWLVHAAQPSFALVALLALAAALQGLWLITASLIVAASRQFSLTPMAFLISMITIFSGYFIVPSLGVNGMAGVLCFSELAMVVWVYRQASKIGVGKVREAILGLFAIISQYARLRRA